MTASLSKKWSKYNVYSTGIFLNLILSFGMLLYRQPFEVDGLIYLNAAQAYVTQGINAAMQVYPWPFYSLLIGFIHQWTTLSLLHSAWLLNALSTSLLVVCFLRLIRICGGTRTTQYWGLAVLLLHPYLNHDRINIVRDFPYYAFFLLSLYCFIRFLRQRNYGYAFLWQLSVMAACFFRIEGTAFLLLLPFLTALLLKVTWRERVTTFIKLTSLTLFVVLLGLILAKSFWHFGRLSELRFAFQWQQTLTIFQQKTYLLQTQIFGEFGKEKAVWFLISGLVSILCITIGNTLGWFSVGLFFLGFKRTKMEWPSEARQGIVLYGSIVLLTLSIFLVQQLFLSERYVVPFVLLMILILPFLLQRLWEIQQANFLKILIISFLSFNAIASFSLFGPSKSYLMSAGEWLEQYSVATAVLYTNDPQLAYYANRQGTSYPQDFADHHWSPHLSQIDWHRYDYIAIVLRRKEKGMDATCLLKTMGEAPLKVFQNKRGDSAYIFAGLKQRPAQVMQDDVDNHE